MLLHLMTELFLPSGSSRAVAAQAKQGPAGGGMGQPAPNTSPQRMRASAAFAPQASQQLQGDWSTLGLPQSAAEDPVLSRVSSGRTGRL